MANEDPERISVRGAWPTEDRHFTPWLAEHMDMLSAVVGLDVEFIQEEAPLPGRGRVDILGKLAGSDVYVVIENQMEVSDNEHFAGLLNYAAHSDSTILIWVASDFTDFHRRTIDWLNDMEGIKIYGVEMYAWLVDGVIQRGLRLVSGPNHRIAWDGYEFPKINERYLEFFRPLVSKLWDKGIARRNVVRISQDQEFPSGFDDINYHAGFWGGPSASVYLWIATAESDYNKRVFDTLHAHKAEIENDFGKPLLWDRRDRMRMSAVIATRKGSIDDPPETLDEIRDWMYNSLIKLKAAIHSKLEMAIERIHSVEDDATS